jgi:hypothetical protein
VTTETKDDCGERSLSPGEFKRALGVHATTVRNWRLKGLVKFISLPSGRYRFPYSEVVRLKNEQAPAPEDSVQPNEDLTPPNVPAKVEADSPEG